MKTLLDRYYKHLRPYRFLWGWAKDPVTKMRASQRGAEWKAKGFRGAKLDVCGGRNPVAPGEFFRVLRPGGMLRVSTPDLEAIARSLLAGDDLGPINQNLFGKYKSDETEDYDVHRWMYPAPAMIKELEEIGFERAEQIPMDVGLHDPRYNYLIRAWKPAR